MKKYLLILSLMVGFVFASGDADKGRTYYHHIFWSVFGFDGTVFTGAHTQKEWKKMFDNNAQGVIEKYGKISPEAKELLEGEKFQNIAPHIEAFAIKYASDSGQIPHCGELYEE